MTHTPTPKPPLVLFSVGNLVLGTGAFIIAGILLPISVDLGVSVAAVGQAMTVYALATALLVPLLLVWTGQLSRKQTIAIALVLVTLGNLLCSLATNITLLMAGRVLMGAGAMFTPIVAGIAVAGIPMAQRGRALSMVFLGISLSYVVGLPLGNWLTSVYNWRLPLQLVAVASLVMLGLLMLKIPAHQSSPPVTFQGVGGLLRNPGVLWPLLLTLLYFTAIFVVFAYIGPVLQALGPLSVNQVSVTLFLFGLSGIFGTLLGGWATDRFGANPTLRVQLFVFMGVQMVLPLTAGNHYLIVAALMVWGTAGFGMMTPQQSRLVGVSPANAPLLLSLNSSMLYLGTALGAVVGGLASSAIGFGQLAWVGLPFVVLSFATLWMGQGSSRKK